MEQAPKGTAQLRERTKIGSNANRFIPVVPSSNEIRRESAIATTAPKMTYSIISILFLYLLALRNAIFIDSDVFISCPKAERN